MNAFLANMYENTGRAVEKVLVLVSKLHFLVRVFGDSSQYIV